MGLFPSHPSDIPLSVFDVLALPAMAGPWLRSTGRLQRCQCSCTDWLWLSEGDFSIPLHMPLLCGHGSDPSKLLLGGNQATDDGFSWHYSFSRLKTLADFFCFSQTNLKELGALPHPQNQSPSGKPSPSVAHMGTLTLPEPLVPSREGCCSSVGMRLSQGRCPGTSPGTSSQDVDGLLPASVLQQGWCWRACR